MILSSPLKFIITYSDSGFLRLHRTMNRCRIYAVLLSHNINFKTTRQAT